MQGVEGVVVPATHQEQEEQGVEEMAVSLAQQEMVRLIRAAVGVEVMVLQGTEVRGLL